jgi:protein-S-isoprenylcysteine O-methyltransferase Ste14
MAIWLRALVFTLVIPGSVLGLVPGLLLADGHGRPPASWGAAESIGLLLALAGVFLYAICLRSFVSVGRGTPAPIDPPRELVAVGAYRFVRNPMYVGVISAVLGEAILFRSSALAVYAGALLIAFHLFVTQYEEPSLRRRFGDSYERYLAAVPRWLPRRTKS